MRIMLFLTFLTQFKGNSASVVLFSCLCLEGCLHMMSSELRLSSVWTQLMQRAQQDISYDLMKRCHE